MVFLELFGCIFVGDVLEDFFVVWVFVLEFCEVVDVVVDGDVEVVGFVVCSDVVGGECFGYGEEEVVVVGVV